MSDLVDTPGETYLPSEPPWRGIRRRVLDFLGWDDPWQRIPTEGFLRRDVWSALVAWAASALMAEAGRSYGLLSGTMDDVATPQWWVVQLAVATACLLFVWRRRFPLTVAALLALHMIVLGIASPLVMQLFPLQALYFLGIYSGTAWARNRRMALVVIALIVVAMLMWIVWQYVAGSSVDDLKRYLDGQGLPRPGIFDPVVGTIIWTVLINAFYFGSAFLAGQLAWRNARTRASLAAQAETIEGQSEALQEYAVTQERVRIARELHDVVAHHVSVMGIQSAAARKLVEKDPARASLAMQDVEASSRQAVAEMRSLLGTLRGADSPTDRAPQPGILEIPGLVERARAGGLGVTYAVHDDLGDGLDAVPGAAALTMHRVVQEALTNVQRHSSATAVDIVLRVARRAPTPTGAPGRPFVEVEIVDNGRPLQGTRGTGLGHTGMRERVAAHGGTLDVGPRATGGYRVRARLPLRQRKGKA